MLLRIVVAFACAVAAHAQTRLAEVRVQGNQRLSSSAIATASGLKVNNPVTRADLDAAAQRLFDTGVFRSVNYRYEPRPDVNNNWSVTLMVAEERATTAIELDISGPAAEALWREAQLAAPLIERELPGSAGAADYYRAGFETALQKLNAAQPLTVKMEADLDTGKTVAVFRPAHVPAVGEIRFRGNQLIRTPELLNSFAHLAAGSEYSERDLRRLLDVNVRPLYENRAHLTVEFPAVEAVRSASEGAVDVTVTVAEGPEWSLGAVEVGGEGVSPELASVAKFPVRHPAKWNEVQASIGRMTDALQKDGYLTCSAKPLRVFHAETGTVDLKISVKKGQQFLFGSLEIDGLSAEAKRAALNLWSIPPGAPMNGPYVDDYLRALLKSAAHGASKVDRQLRPRPGTNMVDVLVTLQ